MLLWMTHARKKWQEKFRKIPTLACTKATLKNVKIQNNKFEFSWKYTLSTHFHPCNVQMPSPGITTHIWYQSPHCPSHDIGSGVGWHWHDNMQCLALLDLLTQSRSSEPLKWRISPTLLILLCGCGAFMVMNFWPVSSMVQTPAKG